MGPGPSREQEGEQRAWSRVSPRGRWGPCPLDTRCREGTQHTLTPPDLENWARAGTIQRNLTLQHKSGEGKCHCYE